MCGVAARTDFVIVDPVVSGDGDHVAAEDEEALKAYEA
jgi:hypothetical protein